MAQPGVLQNEQYQLREVIPYPRSEEFFDLLQDRLHLVVEGLALEDRPFTIFVNTIPREEPAVINRYENVPLIYAGIPRQRELLEGPEKFWKKELDEYWNYLDVTDLLSDTAVVSSQLYREFNLGVYKLEDIPRVGMGRLSDYFASILDPDSTDKEPTPRQVAEYYILQQYFNVEQDEYLSIPLIQFGEFDGICHIIYSADHAHFFHRRAIANLIRSFSVMYEGLVLDWDLVGRNPEKSEAIQLPLTTIFYDQINRNPILKELKFDLYYKRHLPFFKSRIRLNDKVIHSKIYSPYLKTAIISIMIDSYAHNISAHSLVALNWWFKRRAESLRSSSEIHYQEVEEVKELVEEYVPKGFELDRLTELLQPWMKGEFVKEPLADNDVIKYPGSLAREIQPLLGFLMQKGAFWSGIARDNHFGGESRSMFDVLWEDFINNPLYLGTIAKSEDIHKISLRITLYEPPNPEEEQHRKCHRPKTPMVEGVFVQIDIKEQRGKAKKDEDKGYYIEQSNGDRLYYTDHVELEKMSSFVAPGKDYLKVKEALRECICFFPGEVVGRHAFFTMLENEIRNVKHYKGDSLKQIQKTGLELNISLQETGVLPTKIADRELYKVGIWIGTPTELHNKGKNTLIVRKYETMIHDVMDEETFAPRLGGSFQDKICAGMLFNNKFGLVQRGDTNPARNQSEDTDRDRLYYPWITAATSPKERPHDDIELCKHASKGEMDNFKKWYFESNHERGFFKKYMHIWKASNIKEVTGISDADFVWENLARFKFVTLQKNLPQHQSLWEKVRSNGVLRILNKKIVKVHKPEDLGLDILRAYEQWLKIWLPKGGYAIKIIVDGALTGLLVFNRRNAEIFRYYHTDELEKITEDPSAGLKNILKLELAHGGPSEDPSVLRYRNHGIYKTYFMRDIRVGEPMSYSAAARMIEFLEVMTSQICIFDNRIKHRIRNNVREDLYRQKLSLSIYEEDIPTLNADGQWEGIWETQKQRMGPDCQFLIIHLSFIEKLLLTKYGDHPDYEDENIGLFIEQEILPIVTENGKVRENFILVITSGRGRTKWWAKLNENYRYQQYTTFTMFRPVESLISGIEDAVGRKDDIELKYNLVKVLFGT
ncbi:MAG: hypothetical protein MRY78_03195 [Saprospiraceae bacterium]|nr:hypothetical protein [Saprospiraceae bacterium]